MTLLLYLGVSGGVVWQLRRRSPLSLPAALALVLLPLLLTGRAMAGGGVYGPVDLAYLTEPLASLATRVGIEQITNPGVSDVYAEFFPWNDALRRVIADGEWPLWNRFELTGGPLAGALQVAPYHPITLLGLLVPIEDAITFSAAMMFFLAALTMFLFLRELVASESAALLGAAGVMLSTHLVWYAGTALAYAAAAAPLTLLGARRIVHAPSVRSAAILGAGLWLIVQAGHPESALHLVSLAIAWFVFEVATVRPRQWRAVVAAGAGAGVAALLLSAFLLIPFFDDVAQTSEYLHRESSWEGRHHVAAPPEMLHRVRASFLPFLEGMPGLEEEEHAPQVRHGWLATAYAGSLLFAPALFALFHVRSALTWFLLGIALFGLAAGTSAPGVTHLLSALPGFAFAVNDRMIFFAVIAICALAAIGVDSWMQRPAAERRRLTLPRVAIALAILLAVAALTFETRLAPDFVAINAFRAIVPLLLGAAAMVVLSRPKAAVLLMVLVIVQRVAEGGALQPTVARAAFYPKFPGLELMRSDEPFRIVAHGVYLPPATSTHYGLEDARGFQAMTLARYYDTWRLWCVEQPVWFNRVDSLEPPFLSLMNVRFALAPAKHAAPSWWRTLGSFGEYAILENTRVLPRAFVPRGVIHRDANANLLLDLQFAKDFAETSWIESADRRRERVENGPGHVVTRQDGSGLRLRATMQAPGWVVVSNAAWRGWRAISGGRELPMHFANRAFLAFHLPAGEHDVRLVYRPFAFVLGAWISGLTAVALIVGGLWWRRRRASSIRARAGVPPNLAPGSARGQ